MSQEMFERLQQNNPDLNELQKGKIQETLQYLEKHKISQLFNDLLSHVVYEMSKEPRKGILEALKNHKQGFFNEQDFEVIFEHFDPFETKTVKLNSIIQGLQIIGIKATTEDIQSKYQSILKKGFVNKNEFIDILKTEYMSR